MEKELKNAEQEKNALILKHEQEKLTLERKIMEAELAPKGHSKEFGMFYNCIYL
jgi:hypothetical protein